MPSQVPSKQLTVQPSRKPMICAPSLEEGDYVYLDTSNANTCIKAGTNNTPFPVIGYTKKKVTATIALITLRGRVPTTLDEGMLFVGADGMPSLSPAPGWLQRIGYSFGDGTAEFTPELTRYKR